MNILQDILGLFKRKKISSPKDDDLIYIGRKRIFKSNIEDPGLTSSLLKVKGLSDYIISKVPAPPTPESASIPQIKDTSIIFLAPGNSALTAGVSTTSTRLRGIPFSVTGSNSSTGIVLQVQNTSTATLHLALYKYDYDNDIWDIATEQLDVNIAATGVVSQDFTSPQLLEAGLYCVAFRDSNSTGQIAGLFKHRSTNKFGGVYTDMTAFFNLMQSDIISYSPTMPTQITFPSANFVENNYHELFQIKF